MKSRLYNKGINNLTEYQDLSSLITGGFSPNVVIVLKAPKNIEKSKLILNYNRYVNSYLLKWSTTQWWGENISFKEPIPTHHYYEINWKKHTIDKI